MKKKDKLVYGLIGDPVKHSLSPFIFERLFELYGIEADYLPITIPKEKLLTYLPILIDTLGLSGFNVTMPHKRIILPLLDQVNENCRTFRSVNTVVVAANREMIGYNTDVVGYTLAAQELGLSIERENITILGSGASASSLALSLAIKGVPSLTLVARNEKDSRTLQQIIYRETDKKINVLPWTPDGLKAGASDAGLLINTTPLGMTGYDADYDDLSFLKALPRDAVVSDLIYAPLTTAFLQEAANLGHRVGNGLDMLIWQALASFELFCGVRAKNEDKDLLYNEISSLCFPADN